MMSLRIWRYEGRFRFVVVRAELVIDGIAIDFMKGGIGRGRELEARHSTGLAELGSRARQQAAFHLVSVFETRICTTYRLGDFVCPYNLLLLVVVPR